jgi:lipid II:glycine glycyltransferase (peptidoglycan interpeptide bridge formation enzyme)
MQLRAASDTDAPAWQALLGLCPSGDFLHDWAWSDVAAFDGQPQRRYVLEEDGEIVALMAAQVRGLAAGRQFWYVPHGPVLDFADPRAKDRVRALLSGLREVAAAERAVAVKLEPRLEAGSPKLAAFDAPGLRRLRDTLQVGQTRLVDLADDETLLAGFDKDTRYAVRRAEREGVTTTVVEDGGDLAAIDSVHALVAETQRRARFAMPALERYRIAWRALADAGRAAIVQAYRGDELLAAAMVVFEGDRSFYLFSGSRREERGEPKHYASYAVQWAMMRLARERGCTAHDLWGVAPPGAAPEHAWHGVSLFKKGFGGREAVWAGSFDLVVDPTLYRIRQATRLMRGWLGAAVFRGRRRS